MWSLVYSDNYNQFFFKTFNINQKYLSVLETQTFLDSET